MGLRKCSIDIGDVKAFVIECPKCGSSTSYPLDNMPPRGFSHACQNCGHSDYQQLIGNFRYTMADLLTHYDDSPFRIRLEISED